jgi:PLP dependent protein
MLFDVEKYHGLLSELGPNVALVPVSKTKSTAAIMEAYHIGVREFGENYVQELREKQPLLPSDIRWHFIGHLQSNKVKYLAPFIYMIQSVDSASLLSEIDKQARKCQRQIKVLLQVHVAQEETKFGWNPQELAAYLKEGEWKTFSNISIEGVMGMASFVENMDQVKAEFDQIYQCFEQLNKEIFFEHPMTVVSMGMSGDWSLAIQSGSTLVRVGSALFGARN